MTETDKSSLLYSYYALENVFVFHQQGLRLPYLRANAVLWSAEWSLPAGTTHRPRAQPPRGGLARVASRAGPCPLSHSLCNRSWTPSCFPDNKKQLR